MSSVTSKAERDPLDDLLQRNPGFGLGLRPTHYPDLISTRPRLDWLEIISDNFLLPGGRPWQVMEALRPDYPMAMHGVAMSLASPGGPQRAYLQQLKQLADRIQPMWISDHLCWTRKGQTHLHDLNPFPYTDQSARMVIDAILRAQDILQRRLVVENVSSYVQFATSDSSEWEFLSHIAQAADCLLLVDINNIYVSSVNHGFDPLDYLHALPAHRVQQFHLAGHSRRDDHIIDTHDHPVCPQVWDLYAQALALYGPRATMIERDDHIPPLDVLIEELDHARGLAQRTQKSQVHATLDRIQTPDPARAAGTFMNPDSALTSDRLIGGLQDLWVESILQDPLSHLAPVLPHLTPGHHFDDYHHAYRARLTEALSEVFEKTRLYMGADLFHAHAHRFARSHPPRMSNLNEYGAQLPELLLEAYPDHPELSELARLEWHLHEVFAAADVPVLTQAEVEQDLALQWLERPAPLVPHARLHRVTTSVAEIWNAIHQDREVSPVQHFEHAVDILIWRKDLQPHFLSLGPSEARRMQLMEQGSSIAQAHAADATDPDSAGPDDLAADLSRWLNLKILRLH